MADGSGISRAEREAYWREVQAGHEGSGQTLKAYCAERGVSYANCQWWKSELKRRDRKRSAAPVFAEVRPVPLAELAASAIEIAVSGDRVVRVRPGFDAGTLAGVVRVLETL